MERPFVLWFRERVRILLEWLRRLAASSVCRKLPADPRRLGVLALTCATSLVLGWCASWWLVPLYLGLMFWLLGGTHSTLEEAVAAQPQPQRESAANASEGKGAHVPATEAPAPRKRRRAEPGSKPRKRRARAVQPPGSPEPRPVEIRFVKVGPGQFVRVEEPVALAEEAWAGGEPSGPTQEWASGDVEDREEFEAATESTPAGQVENHDDPPTHSTSTVSDAGISPPYESSDSRQDLAEMPARVAVAASDDLEYECELRVAQSHSGGTQDDLPRNQETSQAQGLARADGRAEPAAGPPSSQRLTGPLPAPATSGANGACPQSDEDLAATVRVRPTGPNPARVGRDSRSSGRSRTRGRAHERGRRERECHQRGSLPRAFHPRQTPPRRG